MKDLTLLLFERMGIFLMLTFIFTRIPLFRQLLDRKISWLNTFYFSSLFGLFGILGTYAGVVVQDGMVSSSFWMLQLGPDEAIAHSALVGVVIGGLIGGPLVGIGSGLITGVHMVYLGGFAAWAGGIAALVAGILAGAVARFFSQERVISPVKALFIGMFAPILLMGIILIGVAPPERAIQLVNLIGIPMVLTNSVAIAIFTTMLHVALREEERTAAYETQRALYIAEAALPHLKQGLTFRTAEAVAGLLMRELKAAAVAITDRERILAHAGIGTKQHVPGESIKSELSRRAIETGEQQIAYSHEQIQPHHASLGAAIIVPITEAGKVAGLIKLYFRRPQDIRSVEIVLAQGLGQLISYQLGAAMHEKMTHLMKEAELKVLHAQINPHFLFNTLNSINSLIRMNPELARHVTMQLGTYMRLNLKVTSSQWISFRQEMELLNAYMEIMKIRFEDQFTVECDMDDELETWMIPPATIQLLVENSVNHGLRNRRSGGLIRIGLRRKGGRAEVSVEDNGTGIPPNLLDKLGTKPVASLSGNGIGVYNINQRLIGLFGQEARLHIGNKAEGGCRFAFSIPYMRAEGSEDVEVH